MILRREELKILGNKFQKFKNKCNDLHDTKQNQNMIRVYNVFAVSCIPDQCVCV